MSKLFPNYIIDLEKGTIYSKHFKKNIGLNTDSYGHHQGTFIDAYGNIYKFVHQVIIAEGLQLPKHQWPVDENGERFITDHILPISNGGTDSFENLHLIPRPDNNRNPISRKNYSKWQRNDETKKKISEALKGEKHPMFGKPAYNRKQVFQYTLDGKLIAIWPSATEAAEELNISSSHISECCNGKLKQYKGYKWSFDLKTDEVLID